MNPLIALPSPRKIDVVIEAHEKLKHIPHLWVKYFEEEEAYQVIRNYFLEHTEYTHLVIAPDDLIVEPQHYDALVSDLKKINFPVLSGICNLSMVSGMENIINICIEQMPNIVRTKKRDFKFPKLSELPKGLLQVKFSGFPFMFIRRDIVEKIDFESDRKHNPYRINPLNRGFDLPFCYNCDQLGIPIHVDTRVLMLHLRGADLSYSYGNQVENLLVGKEPKRVYFQKDDEIQDLY